MLWCMTMTNDGTPLTITNFNILAITDPSVACRQRRHVGSELAKTLSVSIQPILRKPGSSIKSNRIVRYISRSVGSHHLAHIKVGPAHPQLTAPTLGYPAHQSGMVGMQMGGDDPRHRKPVQVVGKDALPMTFDSIRRNTCINNGPTWPIT